jgi:hypothetical protein
MEPALQKMEQIRDGTVALLARHHRLILLEIFEIPSSLGLMHWVIP